MNNKFEKKTKIIEIRQTKKDKRKKTKKEEKKVASGTS